MTSITASIAREHYTTTIHSATNKLQADEPVDNGGKDTGFSPSDLLASSLGACTCITLRMYADHKQWPLEGVEAKISFARDAVKNVTEFTRQITLLGNLDADQKKRLMEIADQCPMHRTLSNPIHIHTTLA